MKHSAGRAFRRAAAILLAVLWLGGFSASHAAASGSPFRRGRDYAGFDDVSAGSWYFENVKAAYEFGLMVGRSERIFDPDGEVTVAEGVTLACRLHRILNEGTAVFRSSSPWYETYRAYALENGLAEGILLRDNALERGYAEVYRPLDELSGWGMNAILPRRDFAVLIAAALPDRLLPAVSTVEEGAIPDLSLYENPRAAEAVYRLYRAGILTGSDEAGTFYPDAPLKRSETAAVIARTADLTLRKAITLRAPSCTEMTEEGVRALMEKTTLNPVTAVSLADFDGDGHAEAFVLTAEDGRMTLKAGDDCRVDVWFAAKGRADHLCQFAFDPVGSYADGQDAVFYTETFDQFDDVRVFRVARGIQPFGDWRLWCVRDGKPVALDLPDYVVDYAASPEGGHGSLERITVNHHTQAPEYRRDLDGYVMTTSCWYYYRRGNGALEPVHHIVGDDEIQANLLQYNPETGRFEWTMTGKYYGDEDWRAAPAQRRERTAADKFM